LDENKAGFANQRSIILINKRVKKGANSVLEWPPRLLNAGKARKEGYEERSLSSFFL